MALEAQDARERAGQAQKRAGRLEWGHLRFFLELARTGGLARAARELGVHRNTVARRVISLEEELGLPLFERGPQGWKPTAAGEELQVLARRVEDDVLALSRHVNARQQDVSGTVRLTTSYHFATHLLAPELPALRARHPGLVLEIAADQRTFDLTRQEADLALRVGRPREADLTIRKLADVAYGLYAAPGYLGARDAVDFGRDQFVGLQRAQGGAEQERWLAREGPQRRVVFVSNGSSMLAAAARAGMGVAVLPCFLGDADPGLRRLRGPVPPSRELWLLVHKDLRRTARVSAVIEWVDRIFERVGPRLAGRARDG